MTGPARLRRAVEALVLGRLGRRRRKVVREAIARDGEARAHYDRIVDAMRVLEGREIAELELELVEERLFDDGQAQTNEKPDRVMQWWAWASSFGAVAAVLALVVILPNRPAFDPEGLRAKGAARDGFLGLEVLCTNERARTVEDLRHLRASSREPCALDGTMAFAARLDPAYRGGRTLSVFGVDANGEVRFYAPTPVDPTGVSLASDHWEPLPMAVLLDVNHRVGLISVYALAADEALSVEAVAELGARLGERGDLGELGPTGEHRDIPWHRRLEQTEALARLCPTFDACASAELRLELVEDAP